MHTLVAHRVVDTAGRCWAFDTVGRAVLPAERKLVAAAQVELVAAGFAACFVVFRYSY